jgi:hypothetical protein
MTLFLKKVWIFVATFVAFTAAVAWSDVNPGDVINKENWQKIEGMVPEPVLNWVKKGDIVMNIAELKFDPKPYYKGWKTAKHEPGRFKIEKNVIRETATDKYGLWYAKTPPFANLDVNDPMLGVQLQFNKKFYMNSTGNIIVKFMGYMVSRSRLETEFQALQLTYNAFHLGDNPKDFSDKRIILIKKPFDMAGTAIMVWIYNNPENEDKSFMYVPAIRRVRRMSSGGQSDPFLGSDVSMDDIGGLMGDYRKFDYKLLEVKEALFPFRSETPIELKKKGDGYATTSDFKEIDFGFQDKKWNGAPWAPINLSWVKRKVYVIEVMAKDRRYNYKKQIAWFDTEFNMDGYKIVYDRGGKYWKCMINWIGFYKYQDSEFRTLFVDGQVMVDDRKDHASILNSLSPKRETLLDVKDMDHNDFTSGGFIKFCR